MSVFLHYAYSIFDFPVYFWAIQSGYSIPGSPLWVGAIHNRLLVDAFLWIDSIVSLVFSFGIIWLSDERRHGQKHSRLILISLPGVILLITIQLLLNEQILQFMIPIFSVFAMVPYFLPDDFH